MDLVDWCQSNFVYMSSEGSGNFTCIFDMFNIIKYNIKYY